uniref:Uncharacterized protein n=1 Tax=Rhizophora mucronata TaxID=61149 RepID=A0A2P2IUB6_RHIMU
MISHLYFPISVPFCVMIDCYQFWFFS